MSLFNVTYGTNLLNDLDTEIKGKSVLFVTQANLYDKYKEVIPSSYKVQFIETMEKSALDEMVAGLEEFDVAVGFGGGMSVDAAKYFAIEREKDCYLMPTAISVDACFSYPVAIRVYNKVRYVGKCIPKIIYVDYDIIRSAPINLNLSGVGDVMSCYTALFDWTLMDKHNKGPKIVKELYDKAEEYLNRMFNSYDDIKNVTDKGIRLIMDAYRWVGENGYTYGFCHYEEGSEHYFAYALESVNGKHLLHGQLVSLGIYIMSKFQEEGRQLKIKDFLDRLGLSIKLEDIGISYDDVIAALLKLNQYAVDEQLSFSVLNIKQIDEEFINEVINELQGL